MRPVSNNLLNDIVITHSKTVIVRGIGYRTFSLKNYLLVNNLISAKFVEKMRPLYTNISSETENLDLNNVATWELISKQYLIVRAGHTRDMCVPIQNILKCNTNKKDRKLTVGSEHTTIAMNLIKKIHDYRPPSPYTGRGVRIKHEKATRKAGKKDKQKGRAF